MPTTPLQFEWDSIVAVDDMDLKNRLKPSSILQFFQDIATEHANILDIGYRKMMSMKCFWVLTKVSAEVVKNPSMCERVKILTYPRKPSPVEATRDYYILDSKGEVLVRGSSKWCVLDFANKKIRRTSDVFSYTDEYYYPKDAISGGCTRLRPPADGKVIGDYEVKITDLDTNVHMNNAKYANLLLDYENIDFVQKYDLKCFEINYLGELAFAEKVKIIRAGESGERIYHGVKSDGRDAFLMSAKWEKRRGK
ncbi:MAG: thioesterase [Firmicutes bacterium]|nr:thioesterase [Bacillota bacterium]